MHVAFYDHDEGEAPTEHKVAIAVGAGKSCEKALDESSQDITMGAASAPDLTADQLGRPMQNSAFMQSCGLPESSTADICVAVKGGKAVGVTVGVTPANKSVALCIDRAARKLSFPMSAKLDVVKQHF